MLHLTSSQISAILYPKTFTVVFDTSLGYEVIYNGIMWIKFIKPRVKWFVKREDIQGQTSSLYHKWIEDTSISPKCNSYKQPIDKDHCNYFYDLRILIN